MYVYVHIYIYTHTYIHTYIHMYSIIVFPHPAPRGARRSKHKHTNNIIIIDII